jgi:hypothetical protein
VSYRSTPTVIVFVQVEVSLPVSASVVVQLCSREPHDCAIRSTERGSRQRV